MRLPTPFDLALAALLLATIAVDLLTANARRPAPDPSYVIEHRRMSDAAFCAARPR